MPKKEESSVAGGYEQENFTSLRVTGDILEASLDEKVPTRALTVNLTNWYKSFLYETLCVNSPYQNILYFLHFIASFGKP